MSPYMANIRDDSSHFEHITPPTRVEIPPSFGIAHTMITIWSITTVEMNFYTVFI